MTAYYNENDRHAAQWLRELISAGLIADGVVDERSIIDVEPGELRDFQQCHFFAGIGGWAYALELSGWPEDREAWTGSCPCQPLSVAGKQKGHVDERHLWPAFYRLIAERRPAIVFGEQVAGKDGYEWLAGVRADLEAAGYACGAADLCAAGVGAPHIRQRLFWVGIANGARWRSRMANAKRSGIRGQSKDDRNSPPEISREIWEQRIRPDSLTSSSDKSFRLDDPSSVIRERQPPWNASQFIDCRDGKSRRIPIEPALSPLAHGIPGRLGLLRGSGNAIVPQVAAEFIKAAMQCLSA